MITKKIISLASAGLMACTFATSAAPSYENDGGPAKIYGFLGWAPQPIDLNIGYYQVYPDGSRDRLWIDQNFGATASYFTSGWLREGKLCGTFGNTSQMFYMEFDKDNGQMLNYYEIDLESEPDDILRFMWTSAWNSKDDYVYGFAFNSDYSKDYLVKAPASDRGNVEIVCEMPDDFGICMSVCYNMADNHFYGVDLYGWLVRFDKYGNFEALRQLEIPGTERQYAGWSSGMVYSPKEKCFYWNAQFSDYTSQYVRIDPETYDCELVKELDQFDLFTILCCEDGDATGAVYFAPEFKESKLYNDGGCDWLDLTYHIPEAQNSSDSGRKLFFQGTLGKDTRGRFVSPGEDITLSWDIFSRGYNTISVCLYDDDPAETAAHSNSSFETIWMGPDTPMAPQGVHLEPGEKATELFLEWEAPEGGCHGTELVPESLTYKVWLNGEPVAETSNTQALIEIQPSSGAVKYTATVTAVNQGLESRKGESNVLEIGQGLPVPYSLLPESGDMESLVALAPGEETSQWTIRNDLFGNLALYCPTNRDVTADDYLFLPGIMMDDPTVKKEISLLAGNGSNARKDESFEILIGKERTIDGVSGNLVMDKTAVEKVQYTEQAVRFEVPEAGVYYLAIRCTSAPKMSGIYVRDINVRETDEPASGVESIKLCAEPKVYPQNGHIVVENAVGKECLVYSASGMLVSKTKIQESVESFALPAGPYLIVIDSSHFKVTL